MEEKPIIKERTYSGTTENKENQKVQKFCFADIYKKDGASILLLLLLYVLQGIPLGLAASIPMLMQQKGVSYKEQALFRYILKICFSIFFKKYLFSVFGFSNRILEFPL